MVAELSTTINRFVNSPAVPDIITQDSERLFKIVKFYKNILTGTIVFCNYFPITFVTFFFVTVIISFLILISATVQKNSSLTNMHTA